MSRLLRLSVPALSLAGVALCACGGDDDPPADIDAGYDCTIETRDDEYTAGMELVGAKGFTFRLVSSDPAPPERGDNTWIVEIEDGAGMVDDGTVEVSTFMPDHQHAGSVDVAATPDAAVDGRYTLTPVNMWMPGLWEITVEATPAGGGIAERDFVVFRFCIPR